MASGGGHLSDAELAEVASLADGSLPEDRRREVAARVERSPALRKLLEEQRAALAATRALAVPAPARLRATVEAEARRSGPLPRLRWPGIAIGGGFATALALAVLVAVLILPAGDAEAPTVFEVAELAEHGASAPAPERGQPGLLAASVGGVPFPDYREKFGWRPSGSRTDLLAGRAAQTVFYERGGQRIAYTIVAGEPLEWPPEARQTTREGTDLRSLARDETTLVAWLRGGRTCVLTGAGLPEDRLLELAAWKGEGTVPF